MEVSFRILEENKKFKVQVLKKRFIGKNKWVDFINYSGSDSTFYFSTFDNALDSLIYDIKIETIRNSI